MRHLLVVIFVLILASAIAPVVSAETEYRYQTSMNLSSSWDPSHLQRPFGIGLVEPGFAWITVPGSNEIHKYNLATGERVASQGSTGTEPGQFRAPGGITADSKGNLYVADQGNHRIQRTYWDPVKQAYQTVVFASEGLQTPTGVGVDGDDNVYVADMGGNQVLKYRQDGSQDKGFWLYNPENETFVSPMNVIVDRSNNTYVLNSGRGAVQVYNRFGNLTTSWGGIGNGTGQLNWPYSMTIDTQGDVFVSDSHNDRIQKYSPNGTLLASFGGEGSGIGQLSTPAGITVDSSGIVYVVDSVNNRIVTFKKQDSADTVMIPGGVGVPRDMDDDGTIDDVNGNGRRDFADVVLYFNQMTWIAGNEPLSLFDINKNGRIDFADAVALFNGL